ncbi:unnamed protein product [[Candida] boidinii]|nr:unnamed protein product [[Candida] boidinii]
MSPIERSVSPATAPLQSSKIDSVADSTAADPATTTASTSDSNISNILNDNFEINSINNLDNLTNDELKSIIKNSITSINKFKSIETNKINKLNFEIDSLNNKLNSNLSSNNSNNKNLIKKLEEKELTIRELLDEGNKLSVKEVNLTQQLKKMRSNEITLQESLDNLNHKNQELLEKLNSYEIEIKSLQHDDKILKEENLKNEALQLKFEKLLDEKNRIYNELKEIKFKRLDVQLNNAKKQLDDELKNSLNLENQLNKINTEFNELKESSRNEISLLNHKLSKEKTKLNDIIEENSIEIKRLENKIESLRLITESTPNKLKSINDTNGSYKSNASPSNKTSTTTDSTSSSTSTTTASTSNEKNDSDLLQLQYTQAQENWKLIESSYLKKINDYENDIEILKQKDINYSKKIKTLLNDLKNKNTETNELLENENILNMEIENLNSKLNDKINELNNLNENYLALQKDFESEKSSFESKINLLEDEKNKILNRLTSLEQQQQSQQQQHHTPTTPLYNTNSSNSLYLTDMNSSTSLYSYKRSISSFSANDQIALGESSATPRHPSQASNSSYFQQSHGQQAGGLPPINTSFRMNSSQYSPEINTRAGFPHNGEHEVDPMNYANEIGHVDEDANEDDDDHVTISYMDQSNNQQQGINNELSRSKSKTSSRMSISAGGGIGGIGGVGGVGGVGSGGIGIGLGFRSTSTTNYNNSGYDDEGIITGHSSTAGTGNGGTNIQMITKLSAHVRRLEMELITAKEELTELNKEKTEASNEIIKLIKENERVVELKLQLDDYESKIDELNRNYETTLIILGEKSERVEELNADVEDLKDLLRQQVQQMVELQEAALKNS